MHADWRRHMDTEKKKHDTNLSKCMLQGVLVWFGKCVDADFVVVGAQGNLCGVCVCVCRNTSQTRTSLTQFFLAAIVCVSEEANVTQLVPSLFQAWQVTFFAIGVNSIAKRRTKEQEKEHTEPEDSHSHRLISFWQNYPIQFGTHFTSFFHIPEAWSFLKVCHYFLVDNCVQMQHSISCLSLADGIERFSGVFVGSSPWTFRFTSNNNHSSRKQKRWRPGFSLGSSFLLYCFSAPFHALLNNLQSSFLDPWWD